MSLSTSVAMCTFNGGKFLPDQLASIAAQNRAPDELLVCDDGSSDHCQEIVRNFSRSAPFLVHLLINDKNLGTTENFQKAISLCKGSIILLADQDDVWYPHKMDRIVGAFEASRATVAVFSDADLVDSESRSLDVRLWESFSFTRSEQRRFASGQALSILTKHQVVTGATLAFRKEFFEVLAPFEDIHDRWIAFLLAACGQFEPISEPLMRYRRHSEQQIGPGALTLRDRVLRIKNNDANFYRGEIERFRKLKNRLESHKGSFKYAELAKSEIQKKVAHLENRIALPDMSIERVPKVLREIISGAYWRYSAGWKSAAKDLVWRPDR